MTDYHTRVAEAYAGTLDALAEAGVCAELIDTGGDVKAIWISGTNYDGAIRNFSGGRHAGIMLTAGGCLDETRDPDFVWEGGIYDGGAEQVASLLLERLDRPDQDAALAEDMRRLAEMIR